MAEYVDNMADPPDWADTVTDQVIKSGTLGPIAPDLPANLTRRDGQGPAPEPG